MLFPTNIVVKKNSDVNNVTLQDDLIGERKLIYLVQNLNQLYRLLTYFCLLYQILQSV